MIYAWPTSNPVTGVTSTGSSVEFCSIDILENENLLK